MDRRDRRLGRQCAARRGALVVPHALIVFTIGHGARPAEELVACLVEAGVATLVDVRRFPASRRHPHFNREALAATLEDAGIAYRHAEELGGRRGGEAGEERFGCIQVAAFRSYVARMTTDAWQAALAEELAQPAPCFMCAETPWWRCHRRFVAELLTARGHDVRHVMKPGESKPHRLLGESDVRDGQLFVCGELVA